MGQTRAMVSKPTPLVTIPAKSRIAQLTTFMSCFPKIDSKLQGDQGSGSTGEPQL